MPIKKIQDKQGRDNGIWYMSLAKGSQDGYRHLAGLIDKTYSPVLTGDLPHRFVRNAGYTIQDENNSDFYWSHALTTPDGDKRSGDVIVQYMGDTVDRSVADDFSKTQYKYKILFNVAKEPTKKNRIWPENIDPIKSTLERDRFFSTLATEGYSIY